MSDNTYSIEEIRFAVAPIAQKHGLLRKNQKDRK